MSIGLFEELRVKAEQNRETDDSIKALSESGVVTSEDRAQTYSEMQREEQYFESSGCDAAAAQDSDVVMVD
jgi:hypothetical protein